jgi:hypothetical protein
MPAFSAGVVCPSFFVLPTHLKISFAIEFD